MSSFYWCSACEQDWPKGTTYEEHMKVCSSAEGKTFRTREEVYADRDAWREMAGEFAADLKQGSDSVQVIANNARACGLENLAAALDEQADMLAANLAEYDKLKGDTDGRN
jgi:hypothetical protein